MRPRAVLGSLTAALLIASCGLALEDEAQPITSVPFSLLGTTTSTTQAEPANPAFELQLFWISSADESLIAVSRPQEDQPSVQDALDALVRGPNEAEQELYPEARSPSSVSSLLNPVARPVENGHLIIEVADGTELRDANRLPAAVIVCTVTQFKVITSVEIRDIDGTIPLTDSGSQSIEGAATRGNYNDCIPTVEEPTNSGGSDSEADPGDA